MPAFSFLSFSRAALTESELNCVQIVGKDGPVASFLGGSTGLKRRKNFWSFYRIIFMMVYEAIWYGRQVRPGCN